MRYVTITSARKNPSKNQKLDYRKILEEYKGKGYWISFQNITKFGINPNARDNHTPMGAYVFPLDYVYTNDFVNTINIAFQDAPYVFVVKANTNKILDLNKNLPNFKKQKERITKYFNAPDDEYESYDYGNFKKLKLRGGTCTTAGDLYIYTCYLANNNHRWNESRYIPAPRLMNHAFRYLGYEFIVDNGESIISSYEPIQAIFLAKNAYKIITMENAYHKKEITSWDEVRSRMIRFYSNMNNHDNNSSENRKYVFLLDAMKSLTNEPLISDAYDFKLKEPTRDEIRSLFSSDGLDVPNTKYGRECATKFLTMFSHFLDQKEKDNIVINLFVKYIKNKKVDQNEIEKMLPVWLKKHNLDKIDLSENSKLAESIFWKKSGMFF